MGWLATDKQHGQYAICSVSTSQTAYVPEPVSVNKFAGIVIKVL
jgi:hypothetical protein